MSYKKLYEFCQTLTPPIRRNAVRDKVLELTSVPKVKEQWDGQLNPAICRGYSVNTTNPDHPIYQQHGAHLIVLARDQSNCWRRFVFIKELMHLFDKADELTNSKEVFEKVLTELGPGSPQRSPQMNAEIKAIWMAMGLFCPEEQRKHLAAELVAGKIDSYAITVRLRMPQDHVPHLFSSDYPEIITSLIGS